MVLLHSEFKAVHDALDGSSRTIARAELIRLYGQLGSDLSHALPQEYREYFNRLVMKAWSAAVSCDGIAYDSGADLIQERYAAKCIDALFAGRDSFSRMKALPIVVEFMRSVQRLDSHGQRNVSVGRRHHEAFSMARSHLVPGRDEI